MLKLVVAAFLIGASLTAQPQVARANPFLQDLWGIATDPLKLGQFSTTVASSAERILIELNQLRQRANHDISARLQELRSIIEQTMTGTKNLIADAEARIIRLEAQVYQDAMRLLHEAECAAETVLNDKMQRSFADLLGQIREARPGIRLFGIRIISADANEVKIEDPDQAYIAAKRQALEILKQTVTDGTPAYRIVSTYENLARAARYTRCHYRSQAHAIRFTQEINDLQRLSLPWLEQVRPEMINSP